MALGTLARCYSDSSLVDNKRGIDDSIFMRSAKSVPAPALHPAPLARFGGTATQNWPRDEDQMVASDASKLLKFIGHKAKMTGKYRTSGMLFATDEGFGVAARFWAASRDDEKIVVQTDPPPTSWQSTNYPKTSFQAASNMLWFLFYLLGSHSSRTGALLSCFSSLLASHFHEYNGTTTHRADPKHFEP